MFKLSFYLFFIHNFFKHVHVLLIYHQYVKSSVCVCVCVSSVCVCVWGEPCQDMFVSSEYDVHIACAPSVPHMLFPAAPGERTGPVYCWAPFAWQWHTDPGVLFQLSEQQSERWRSHAGVSLSDL